MKPRSPILRYRLDHLLLWLTIGGLWYYLRADEYSTVRRAVLVTLIKTADLALMVYIANYLLIPKLLYRKRYALFALAYIAMVVTSSLYKMHLIGRVTHIEGLLRWWEDIKGRVYDNVLPHFLLVTAGVAVKLLIDYTRAQQKLAVLAREKAEAELNFLKSQINPHFIFNSLNAVYFLIDKENAEARQALHTFSEMLRYQLYEIGDEKIPIEKEIRFLQDYVHLQSLRSDHCAVRLDVDDSLRDFSIEPLLLIPFVENSFKHLSHYSERSNEINIGLWKKNGSLVVQVRNTTEGGQANGAAGGIGLDNVRRRLQLLYPHRHLLTAGEEGGWYRVDLHIKMDNGHATA